MEFIVAQVDYDYPDTDIEKQIIEDAGGTLISAHLNDEKEIVDFAKDADALIVQYANISRTILSNLPKCKVVSRYGIGIDNVDVEAAKELGIYVAHNPEYCVDEVSDHALAFLMSLHRQIGTGTAQIKNGIWDFSRLTPVKAVRDTIVGIVGFGKTGQTLARKLMGIGFQNIIYYDPFVSNVNFDDLKVKKCSLEELMAKSDIVSIHSALTKSTTKLINKELINSMKPTAYLVNTSRGGVVDNEALFVALKNGVIRGAGLDVLDDEPPKDFTVLRQLDNLYLTPHLAFYSDTSIIELRSSIAHQVVQVMRGDSPKFNAY